MLDVISIASTMMIQTPGGCFNGLLHAACSRSYGICRSKLVGCTKVVVSCMDTFRKRIFLFPLFEYFSSLFCISCLQESCRLLQNTIQ